MLKKSHLTFALVIISLFLIINAPANNPRRVNERFVIKSLQTIFAAQATFAATRGNGNYGSNFDLLADGLIDEVLANGNKYGYHFIYFNSPGSSPSSPSRFYVTATPQLYGKTGKMSFFSTKVTNCAVRTETAASQLILIRSSIFVQFMKMRDAQLLIFAHFTAHKCFIKHLMETVISEVLRNFEIFI
jgi:hypothetical protein